jgi:hypothetical protein
VQQLDFGARNTGALLVLDYTTDNGLRLYGSGKQDQAYKQAKNGQATDLLGKCAGVANTPQTKVIAGPVAAHGVGPVTIFRVRAFRNS